MTAAVIAGEIFAEGARAHGVLRTGEVCRIRAPPALICLNHENCIVAWAKTAAGAFSETRQPARGKVSADCKQRCNPALRRDRVSRVWQSH